MPPKLNKDDRFKQGIFVPKNASKFIGKYAIFRSSYEQRFFIWADNNPNILEWGSENVVIPYKSPLDGKHHRYYLDCYIVIKEGNNISKYLIEIKPYNQTQPPKPSKRKKQKTILYENAQYAVNKAKWDAAQLYAASKDAEFLLITERELSKLISSTKP